MVTRILALTLFLRILSAQNAPICDETLECYQQVITNSAYCNAYRSCEEAVITTNVGTAYCHGHDSCKGATIITAFAELYGKDSGESAKISTSDTMYIEGYFAARDAQIEGSLIYAYGFRALYFATVEPISDNLLLYLYGRGAGDFASIKCYSGHDCDIYCAGNGCANADFYCYTGATCTYHCNDEEDCPTLYGGPDSALTDAMIDKIFEENRKKFIDEQPHDKQPSFTSKPRFYHSLFNSWQFATVLCVLNAISMIFAVAFCLRNGSKGKYENLNVAKKEVFE